MIAIIDYGLGNVRAFANIYQEMNVQFRIARTRQDLQGAARIILPGVGAFDQAMLRLQSSGMREPLEELARHQQLPVLGVCVGMQILAASSEEGVVPGLGWIGGEVVKFRQPPAGAAICVPHMGWNTVQPSGDPGLFRDLDERSRFYFLHSYLFQCARAELASAQTTYGAPFACAVHDGNIHGVQFHPEKSHRAGIQLLKNFAEL